jgi:DNA repair protein SbcD/Mre11
MAFRFMHVDDVHIGRERLEGALPSSDFSNAFNQAVDVAIEKGVAFMLVAGDFFDKARIEPNHLAEGEAGLRRLKDAGIPVIAIEGNHDVVSSYDDRPSWLTYLNGVGLLRLLRTEFREGQPIMKEWNDTERFGNWLDLGGARIYGAGWFGASTARRLELLEPHLEKRGFTILMLHAGVNGMAEEFGMIDRGQLDVVREKVDYAALGHMHKSYVVDGWAHNAGALENWDLGEVRYGDEKGYWLVDVRDDGTFEATHGYVKRRPVQVAKLDCDGLKTLEELRTGVVALAAGWTLDPSTVVCLRLTGLPAFNPSEIDRKDLEIAVVEAARCAAAEVSPAFGRRAGAGEAEGDIPPREAVEAEEIAKLIAETGRYEGKEEVVASLLRSVLAARGDEELYGELSGQAGPLLGDVDEAS